MIKINLGILIEVLIYVFVMGMVIGGVIMFYCKPILVAHGWH